MRGERIDEPLVSGDDLRQVVLLADDDGRTAGDGRLHLAPPSGGGSIKRPRSNLCMRERIKKEPPRIGGSLLRTATGRRSCRSRLREGDAAPSCRADTGSARTSRL